MIYNKQKISKDIKDFIRAINQLDLIDIYGNVYPIKPEFTLFSNASGTFAKINHVLPKVTFHRLAHRLWVFVHLCHFTWCFLGMKCPSLSAHPPFFHSSFNTAQPLPPLWGLPHLPQRSSFLPCMPVTLCIFIHPCLYHSMLNYMDSFSASPTQL